MPRMKYRTKSFVPAILHSTKNSHFQSITSSVHNLRSIINEKRSIQLIYVVDLGTTFSALLGGTLPGDTVQFCEGERAHLMTAAHFFKETIEKINLKIENVPFDTYRHYVLHTRSF